MQAAYLGKTLSDSYGFGFYGVEYPGYSLSEGLATTEVWRPKLLDGPCSGSSGVHTFRQFHALSLPVFLPPSPRPLPVRAGGLKA